MNPRTFPARSAARYPVTDKEGRPPIPGFPSDSEDLCCRSMDRAIGIEKESLAAIVSLHANAIDVYEENASRFPPALGNCFDMLARIFACCMELQTIWLTLLLPHAGSTVVSVPRKPAQPTDEASERSMDFAVETFENY